MALRAHLVNPGKSPRLKTLNEITAAQLQRPLSPNVFAVEGNSHVSQGCGLGYLGGQYSANHRLVEQRGHSRRGEPRREVAKSFRRFRNKKESAVVWMGQSTGPLARAGLHEDSSVALCATDRPGQEKPPTFQSRGGTRSGLHVRKILSATEGGRLQVGT